MSSSELCLFMHSFVIMMPALDKRLLSPATYSGDARFVGLPNQWRFN